MPHSHSRARGLGECAKAADCWTCKGCLKASGCLIHGLASVQSYVLVHYFDQEHVRLVSAWKGVSFPFEMSTYLQLVCNTTAKDWRLWTALPRHSSPAR